MSMVGACGGEGRGVGGCSNSKGVSLWDMGQ